MTSARPAFNRNYLDAEYKKYSANLERPVTIYLIGGGAMAFRNLKTATKDVDFLVENNADAKSLIKAVEKSGYSPKKSLTPDYEQMLATAILEDKRGFRVDIFTKKVCNKLELTPTMKARATETLEYAPNLTIRILANEDIMLLKGVTDRQNDQDDMEAIIRQTRLDWQAILDESDSQHNTTWESAIYEKLAAIAEKGYRIPILRQLEKRNGKNTIVQAILDRLSNNMPLEDAKAELRSMGFAKKEIDEAWLEHK